MENNENHEIEIKEAEAHLKRAEADLKVAHEAEKAAEGEIEVAIHEIEEAEEHHHQDTVEIKVDREPERVAPGTYIVSAFKALVGVDANRELDILRDGTLCPLEDNAEITIRKHEVFVSHARSGGSS